MMETLDTPDILEKKPRRAFLIVLSVITFISVLGRLGFAGTFFVEMPLSRERLEYDSSLRWVVFFFLAIALSAFVNGIGSILMLTRKKGGYLVYLAGQIVFLLGSVCFTFSVSSDFGHIPWFGYVILLSLYLIPVIFIFLYKAALKQNHHGRTL